jgi:hypothetical protein
MSKVVLDAIKNGTVETKFTAIIQIITTHPLSRQDIAKIWLTDGEIQNCVKSYRQFFIKDLPTLIPPRALRYLWDMIQPKHVANGDVKIKTTTTFRWSVAETMICAKKGYKSIFLSPQRGNVNKIMIENMTDEKGEHDTKMFEARKLIKEMYPFVELVVDCQFSGPCGLLKQ